jgi:hypothetical protein
MTAMRSEHCSQQSLCQTQAANGLIYCYPNSVKQTEMLSVLTSAVDAEYFCRYTRIKSDIIYLFIYLLSI